MWYIVNMSTQTINWLVYYIFSLSDFICYYIHKKTIRLSTNHACTLTSHLLPKYLYISKLTAQQVREVTSRPLKTTPEL